MESHRQEHGDRGGRWWRRPAAGRIVLAALFATVLAQMIAMALVSRYDAHPDERSHVSVAEYYLRYWMPPAAADPRVIPTLSNRGLSYHYNVTAAYFLAGKAVAPVQELFAHPHRAFRLFNVGLFALLAGLALTRRDPAFALLLLLLPAQVWYVFSYYNDDALALFLCLVCSWQVAGGDAAGRRFLSSEGWGREWRGAAVLALLVAGLLLSKKNYWAFLLFLAFYAAWTAATSGHPVRARRLAARWGTVGLLAAALAWPRFALDAWVNDPARAAANQGRSKIEVIHDQAERYAPPGFKPSEYGTSAAFHQIRMKSRGVPLGELFGKYRWHELAGMSFVGLYGYMDIPSDPLFYMTILVAYAGLLLTLAILVFRDGSTLDRVFALACSGFCAGLVLLSIHHSWVNDFQPQGRYLFPAFGVLFLAVLKLRELIPRSVLWRYGALIWLLSCYSFVFTGLRLISREP